MTTSVTVDQVGVDVSVRSGSTSAPPILVPMVGLALSQPDLTSGLMKDHGQQARASENFAGPVDFETPRPDLPVHFLNFHKPWLFLSLLLIRNTFTMTETSLLR